MKFVSKGPINIILDSIGSDNGSALVRQQAIIWISDSLV